MILVTGGNGLIGSSFFVQWPASSNQEAVGADALTDAGPAGSQSSGRRDARYHLFYRAFRQGAAEQYAIPGSTARAEARAA